MPIYQISCWDTNFENSRSREIEHPAFVQMPNKQHGMGFQRILGQADGVAMFGLWCLILQGCSRQKNNERQKRDGWLTDDGTATGVPWDAEDIALRWKQPVEFVQRSLELFCHPKVGWLRRHVAAPASTATVAADRLPTNCRPSADASGGNPQDAADRTGRDGTGQDRTVETSASPPPSPARERRAARPVKVTGIDLAMLRRGLESPDLRDVVRAFGANGADDRMHEWGRDAVGLTMHTIAVILWWQIHERRPVREPSGFRAARAWWRDEISDAKRVRICTEALAALGIEAEVVGAQAQPVAGPPPPPPRTGPAAPAPFAGALR